MPVALRLLAVALTAAALAACAQQPPVMTSSRPAVQEGARKAVARIEKQLSRLAEREARLATVPPDLVEPLRRIGQYGGTMRRGFTGPGDYRYEGADLQASRDRATRRRIQMVFQDPYASLNPRHTVGTIIGWRR